MVLETVPWATITSKKALLLCNENYSKVPVLHSESLCKCDSESFERKIREFLVVFSEN